MIQNRSFLRTCLTLPTMLAIAAAAGCSPASEGPVDSVKQADIADTASMVACPADDSDPECPAGSFAVTCKNGTHEVATAEDIRNDRICDAAPSVKTKCMLLYMKTRGCAGSCPLAVVGTFDQTVSASYPSLFQTLGSQAPQTMPYSGVVAASPKLTRNGTPLSTDGYFDFGIRDNVSGLTPYSSQAEVSLSRVHEDVGGVIAGDLRATVADFEYQGKTYDLVDVLCNITPG